MAIGRDNVSDPNRYSKGTNATKSDMSMMRIAVAGTGGLALLIAHYITEDTSHHVVLLSRQVCLHQSLACIASMFSNLTRLHVSQSCC